MEDAYAYPLLIDLDENSIPNLKYKLVKYFQSKKSNGGDCEADYENGSRTAVLRFRRKEDQQNVLAKKAHQISLACGVLNATVRSPTDETGAEETPSDTCKEKLAAVVVVKNKQSNADEMTKVHAETKGNQDETEDNELDSTSAVLQNIPAMLCQEVVEMLVENITNIDPDAKWLRKWMDGWMDPDASSTSKTFTLDFSPGRAVVTFQTGKEAAEFVERCPQNMSFTKWGISVRHLEATKQVVVEDFHSCSKDLLLYFELVGGDVENVLLNEADQSAIITFKDHSAVQKVVKKKKHQINNKEIRVSPFYKSLGTALCGKDTPTIRLPEAFSEPIDNDIWKYLIANKPAAETVHRRLAKVFCSVNLSLPPASLSPDVSLQQQKDAEAIIKNWKVTAKAAFAQAMSQFKSLKLQPESEVWEEYEMKISQILRNENVLQVLNRPKEVFTVVGFVADINRLQPAIEKAVKEIVERLQQAKSSITQTIPVSPSILHILFQNGLKDKLLNVYPELKISLREGSSDFTLTGLNSEIISANNIILDVMYALKHQTLELDTFLLELLQGEDEEELTNALLKSNGINAAFNIGTQAVELVAVSHNILEHAEDHLRRSLKSQYINVEDVNVLKKPEWKDLVEKLQNAKTKSSRRIQIHTTDQQVVVSGHKDDVVDVSAQLDDFLKQNAHVEETVVIKPNIKVKYVKRHEDSWFQQVKDKVKVLYGTETIRLSGSRVHVAKCKTLAEALVSSVILDRLIVSKSGVMLFFQDKEAEFSPSLFSQTGCVVQLVEDTSAVLDELIQSPMSQPVVQLQTPNKVEIVVCKADLCSYPVQAVISPTNSTMNQNAGLSGALLKAAGPQLQAECDRIRSINGLLKPGDCVITKAMRSLCCNKVIFTVGPMFDVTQSDLSQTVLKKAVKGSLDLAGKRGCQTVALPCISRTTGFPLQLCANTIIKAAKEYCEGTRENTIKAIHFVDSHDSVVEAFKEAVKQEWGPDGASLSFCKGTQCPPVNPTGSDPNCLGLARTREGLEIMLTKGKFGSTMVDATAVTGGLVLSRQKDSSAILTETGPKPQLVVNAKEARGTGGDIVAAEGCTLKDNLFYAAPPQWKHGQSTAENSLSGIFKDCLCKAEGAGLSAISFPAIWTGNLGFPMDIVAELMLNEISSFSRKGPPIHLKKVLIIFHPEDAHAIQEFTCKFKKKFFNGSEVPAPTSSGPFSKIASKQEMHETKLGSVVIQVVTGNITEETTDVIVNSSNQNFSLKSGVSKAILDAAGQTVEDLCRTLGSKPNSGIIVTQPGNLKCKKILHLVGPSDLVSISKVMKDALQQCVTNSFTSVSFPAIGTGQGNLKPKQVADAMLDTVIDVLGQNTSSLLKMVRIVIFQQPMLKDFYDSMKERETPEPIERVQHMFGTPNSKICEYSTGPLAKLREEQGFVNEAVAVVPACFYICGESQAQIDSAKKMIDDLISRDQCSKSISDKAIGSFSDADRQRIIAMQKTMYVSIRIKTTKAEGVITIKGFRKFVLEASVEIHKMVRKAKDETKLKNRKVRRTSALMDWQLESQGFHVQSLDPLSDYQVEPWITPSIKVPIQGRNYTIYVPAEPAIDKGQSLEKKHIDKFKDEKIPRNWDSMPNNSPCAVITINAGTAEHTEVQNQFQASCRQTITKIERIQNPTLWISLQIKKHDMEQRNDHQNNEKRLFHGTTQNNVAYINQHGFNRSYAGINGASFGKGTYFALKASYSAQDIYSKPNAAGEKCMYLCRVLTGDYTLGQQDMIAPPSRKPGSVELYDSVVDNMASPSIFVIFHDIQAYPEYLITFK